MSYQLGCFKCSGTGFVTALARKTGSMFAFMCPCPFGRSKHLSKHIPVWKDFYFKDYIPDNFEPSFPDPKQVLVDPKKNEQDDVPF